VSQLNDRATTVLTSLKDLESDRWLRVSIWLGLGSFLVSLISYNFVDIDLWHQMALMRESLSAGHLLRADPYAYTPTIRPWIDHEWGAGAVAYFTTLWFGARVLILLKFALALGTVAVSVKCARLRATDSSLVGVCALLATFLSYLGFFAAVRAQAYSFFLTALLLLFLEQDRKGSRAWIAAWLVLFPVWVNLHGGFVVAIGLIVLHILDEFIHSRPIRHLLVLFVTNTCEIFLNPYRMDYFSYLKRALVMVRPYSPEWRPVWDLGPAVTIAFIAAVIIAVYAVASAGVRRASGMLVLAATVLEGAMHRKLLPLFAVAWLCYIPSLLETTRLGDWVIQFTRRRVRFMRLAWTALACIGLVAALRQKPWELSVPQPIYPVGPVEYLARHQFQGNLMVPFRLGAYVSWKLFPAVKVSLDSRYEEVYSNEVVGSIFRFYDAVPEWRQVLDRYSTDAVLLPADAAIASKMLESGWNGVYLDQQFQLYLRPGRSVPFEDKRSSSFIGQFP